MMPYHQLGGYSEQGSFFGSIGNFLGHIATGAVDLVTGNIGGAVGQAGAALGIGSGGSGTPSKPAGYTGSVAGLPTVPKGTLAGQIQANLPGGASGTVAVPRGYHVSKTSGKVVKNRRRNYTNQKALRHAISRVSGFERQVKSARKSLRRLAKI